MGKGGCVGLALQVCAALGNEPKEKFSGQSSDLAKGLKSACTFIGWDLIEAFWRQDIPLPDCRRSGTVGALGTLSGRLCTWQHTDDMLIATG